MAKILLVEDDQMISEIYMKKFKAAGFEVENAKSGKETLKMLKMDKFDLVLLDMVLPEMSGMDILKEVKAKDSGYDEDVKIYIFSNLSQQDTRDEAIENGADGFIGKTDHTPSEVVEKVKEIINRFSEIEKNSRRPKLASDNQEVSEVEQINQQTASVRTKKILFIEDEEVFTEMFGQKLQDEGYEVIYADNGAWGIEEATKNHYDLIITDMMLPNMGGEEIVSQLKQGNRTKNIPIVVISASVDDEGARRVKEMGIKDFFLKTHIVPSDLSRRVGEILNEK